MFGPGWKAVAQFATVCAPASSATVWLAPPVNCGASLAAVTKSTRKVCVVWPPLASIAVTLNSVKSGLTMPLFWSVAVVKVTVRL